MLLPIVPEKLLVRKTSYIEEECLIHSKTFYLVDPPSHTNTLLIDVACILKRLSDRANEIDSFSGIRHTFKLLSQGQTCKHFRHLSYTHLLGFNPWHY